MKKVLLLFIAVLAFCGLSFAQIEPYWGGTDLISSWYEDHSTLVTKVSLDNNIYLPQDNYANIEVAAFVTVDGKESYRGSAFMFLDQLSDPYPVVQIEIYYDTIMLDEYGDFVTVNQAPLPVYFKMYDHGTGTLYDYWTCTADVVTETSIQTWNFNRMPTLSFFHTYTKEIDPYTSDGGYYLIASPIGQVMAKDVVGLRTPDFDFYSFEQNAEYGLEWINHRNQEEYPLQPGVGYLYANSTGEDLIFVGAPYTGEGDVTLAKEEGTNVEFPGWNLVGNPFAQKAYIDRTEFYVMNGDGNEIIAAARDYVNAMEGIFVIASEHGESLTFSTQPSSSKGQIVLDVRERDKTIDRAIVRFGGNMLPKFMLNQNNTKMYLSKDGNDFAVVRGNKSGSLPVNFEPAEDGTYVISGLVQNVKNMRYLHLIDNKLGTDIDLLRTPEYKFEAKKVDRVDRFVLVFATTNLFNTMSTKGGDNDDFSFFSNGNWIISNEGEAVLQVVDVNGRILSSEEINGSVSKRIEAAPGVYMLRLINGKDMKVQKVVVE